MSDNTATDNNYQHTARPIMSLSLRIALLLLSCA